MVENENMNQQIPSNESASSRARSSSGLIFTFATRAPALKGSGKGSIDAAFDDLQYSQIKR